jgi:hypothetical protein
LQLRRVRETVPSILRPLHAKHVSPEDLYLEFAQTATLAVGELKNLTARIQTDEMKKILDRGKEDKNEENEEIQEWLDIGDNSMEFEDEKQEVVNAPELLEQDQALARWPDYDDEDISTVVEKFRADFSGRDIQHEKASNKILVNIGYPFSSNRRIV